jgi:hypothetical protein
MAGVGTREVKKVDHIAQPRETRGCATFHNSMLRESTYLGSPTAWAMRRTWLFFRPRTWVISVVFM